MAAKKKLRRIHEISLQRCDRILQPGAIALRIARSGWAIRTILAIGQIATQHGKTGLRESLGNGDQQWRAAICSRTMRQN
jgi:hypothetical protein